MGRSGIQHHLFLLTFALVTTGCTLPLFRAEEKQKTSLEQLAAQPDSKLISKFTHPFGMNYVQIEGVALVTGLQGTGEDPAPTPQRAALLDDMQRRNVEKPLEVLASPDTAIVVCKAYLRPGIKEGERFDLEVKVPSKSATTSLRGGWMMSTRLAEMAVLGQQIREGHVLGVAEGSILIDPAADGETDVVAATRGRILSGGVATKTRPLGLVIGQEYRSVRLATEMAKVINDRFFDFREGRKQGVAEAKTDEYVELHLHSRYRDNVARYIRVVRSIAVNESPSEQIDRLAKLEDQLLDPISSARAAVRLEAIGNDEAIGHLKKGALSDDPEVRFYSAEALAYLDRTEAVEPLLEAARGEPAFRVNALAALSTMDDVTAYEALRSLLEASSAETRYGAFRALWVMNSHDPLIGGEQLGGQFSFHELDVAGPPMVHVTRSYRPEIVLFGKDQHFQLPLVLDAGKNILVNGISGKEVTVSRFTAGGATRKVKTTTRVSDVIRTIVELGGAYPDVVQALQQAKHDNALASRFRVDALPESGRSFVRGETRAAETPDDEQAEEESSYEVATPLPDLFSKKR